MMTETQKRIKAYKAALPGLRQRVFAVGVMLAISVVMMISASYSWYTLSVAPEVSGAATTVTANGSLEIALSNASGSEPGVSAVGDSSSTDGQSVVNANLTWGNLINLSDESYGLDNIVLRPALLGSSKKLLDQPLKGVDYGEDGRVNNYNEDFSYTSWVEPANGVDGYFGYSETPKYGVRAISTTQTTYKDTNTQRFAELLKEANSTRSSINDKYDAMVANDDYIDALADLIGVFLTDKLNDSDTAISTSTIENIYKLLVEFDGIVDDFGGAIVDLANVQVYNKWGRELYENYDYTKDAFFEAYTADTLTGNGVSSSMVSCVKEYLRIKLVVKEALEGWKTFYDRKQNNASEEVLMGELTGIINKLVNINTCEIVVISTGDRYKVQNIGVSAALNILGKDINAVITAGALKDFEQLTGFKLLKQNVTVKAKYIVTVSMTAKNITTSAAEPFTIESIVAETEKAAENNLGDLIVEAQDTYGMVLDFWVRTNAPDSYLTLEGNILSETNYVQATGIDMDGNPVDLYTTTITIPATVEGEEDYEQKLDVYYYKGPEDTEAKLYNADTHALMELSADQTMTDPVRKMEEVTTIIGYEGENRVWEENALLDTDSTTQGSGSCYVFYSDDPAQQLSSLQLLSNLRVAFIDNNEDSEYYGKMVAIACLDTENYYASDGKFILPLKLMDDGSSYLTHTTDTEDGLAVTALEQNEATRLTAIVFLDGREITNSQVLAANEIQGRLNIQFGSSTSLTTMGDSDLEMATRSVSAQAKKSTETAYGDSTITFDFDTDESMKVDVAVTVEGDQPNTVTAFFMRRVNATQGSREQTFELSYDPATGKYIGTYEFTSPGTYVLRTVQLDGVDYDLPTTSYPKVEISGFNISSVTCDAAVTENAVTIMTGDSSVSTNLTLKFASSKKTPNSVQLQFVDEDGSLITANMSYNSDSDTWSGKANFTTSGTYTLRYVVMDGEYAELEQKFQRELTIYLGMTVRVRDDGTSNEVHTYVGEALTIPVYVDIYDNTGEKLPYLQNAKLAYGRSGSILNGMDADLKWSVSNECYMGNLQMAEPGYYTFMRVSVGSSYLTVTTETPPAYTFVSPEPPAFVSITMPEQDYILAQSNKTDYSVQIKMSNAQAAKVSLLVYDADTKTDTTLEYVEPYSNGANGITTFNLNLPIDSSTGYQVGDWTVKTILVANAYDSDSVYHTTDNPLTFDISQSEDDRHVQIVSLKVTASGAEEHFKDKAFMESATTTKSITINITDHRDRALNSDYVTISNVELRYQHAGNDSSKAYGGYTADHLDQDGDGEWDTYTPTANGDSKTYTYTGVKLTYAGVYNPYDLQVTLKMADSTVETKKYDNTDSSGNIKLPVYSLQTIKPTVSISAIAPSGSHNSVKGTTSFPYYSTVTVTSGISGNTATVYPEATYSRGSATLKTEPQVTLALTGIGKASKATVTFTTEDNNGTVYMYTSASHSGQTDSFTWDAGGTTCKRYIGYNDAGACQNSKVAGTLTAETLILEYTVGNVTTEYKVAIDKITIINNKPS